MNFLIFGAAHMAWRVIGRLRRLDQSAGRRFKNRFGGDPIDNPQPTGRTGMVVDRTALPAAPTDAEQFIPRAFANQIAPPIRQITEIDNTL